MRPPTQKGQVPPMPLQNRVTPFGELIAVRDISLDIRHGEFLTLLGPSGCGKICIHEALLSDAR